MNDISKYPVSSYRPVEVQLARLHALSGLDLQADPQITELFKSYAKDQAVLEALASDSSKKRTRETQQAKDIKT
jgi:hypothetical protein